MKRKLLSLILALSFFTNPAFASKAAVGGNTENSALTAGVTRYAAFYAGESWQTTSPAAEIILPWDATVSNLYISGGDPGGGNSITYTVQRNGADTATSLISCQGLTANSGDCTDTDSDDFTAGDTMSLKAVVSAGLGAAFYVARLAVSVDYGAGKSAFVGGDNAVSSATTAWVNPSGDAYNTTESVRTSPVGIAFTASTIYMKIDTAPDNGVGTQSWTFTVQKNGGDSDDACTISESATSCSFTSGTTTWAAGDTISIKRVATGTPTNYTNSAWGVGVTIAEGYTPVQTTNSADPSTTAVQGSLHGGNDGGWTSADFYSKYTSIPHNYDVKNLYVITSAAPTAGKSYTIDIDTAYGGAGSVGCTVADANTSCNDTSNTDSFTASMTGKGPSILSTPSGTPTAGRYRTGYTQFAYGTGEPSASGMQVVITG